MMRICSDKAIIFAECTPKAKAFGVHSFMEMKLLVMQVKEKENLKIIFLEVVRNNINHITFQQSQHN